MAQQNDCSAVSWSLHGIGRVLVAKPRRAQSWGIAQGAGSFVRPPNSTQGASGNVSHICLATAKVPAPADFEESHGVKDRRESGSQCSTSRPEARSQALRAITDALRETKARPYREPGCVSNAVEKPNFARRQQLEEKPEKVGEETVERGRRRRGRPSGICPWNKGARMLASTRAKISNAQKARWRDPALKLHMQQSQKLKGKTPWNKGKSMSVETRQRMSAAKQFAVYPRSTTAKMSRSHVGLTHSPETCALISKRLTGRQKSSEHRAAIAAGQRKRAAALKMINAVRAPQKEYAPKEVVPEPELVPEPEPQTEPELHPDSGNMYTSGSVPHTRNRKKVHSLSQNEAVVEEFVGQLRQFRALQQELAPWTEAFRSQHGRKPRVEDVEITGINWLIVKFKDYMRTRDHLLNESQQLRTKLESGTSSLGTNSYSEKMNANAGTGAMSKGAVRMAKALQYKRSKAAAVPCSDRLEVDSETVAASGAQDLQQITAAPPTGSATDAAAKGGDAATLNRAAHTSTQPGLKAFAEGLAKKQTPPLEEVRNPQHLVGASPRVKNAMLAAAQYKKKQAMASAAVSNKNSPTGVPY